VKVEATILLNGVPVAIELGGDTLAAIAAALPDHDGSPWLAGAQAAADYLGWPRERIYKRLRDLPHYRDEGRLMFRRDELDVFIAGGRER
jgi:hypothetical protein